MKVHIKVNVEGLARPLDSREMNTVPEVGTVIPSEIEGDMRQLSVDLIEHFSVVPSGTFKHNEVWLTCHFV